jgi:hypothetical protein
MSTVARTLFFGTLAALAYGLLNTLGPARAAGGAPTERVVYLARDLPDEALVTLSATAAARGSLLLLDSARSAPYVQAFLGAFRPTRVVPVGTFPGGTSGLERRLDLRTAPVMAWPGGPPLDLWRSLYPRAEAVVVCPAAPRGQLLQAACLAGALRAPFVVSHGDREIGTLRDLMAGWRTRRVYLVGQARDLAGDLTRDRPGLRAVWLRDGRAAARAYERCLARERPVRALVVANPADTGPGFGGMSALAPWVALRKHAALLLTNDRGDNVEAVVQEALGHPALRRADALILVADLRAIPMQERPNPIPADKDPTIEMEPLTPRDGGPFTFATGRLFHEDPAVVALLLAREELLARARGPRRALVASNAGGGLSLLEAFSRNTAQELRNAGYETTALFGKEVQPADLRRLLTANDIFLWEGHHNTLIREYGFAAWDEPMPPAFVFLQSCLALKDYKVQPLLSRGAVGVVGSSTRTYSGSGGACSLAFFDALLYEGQSVGASLRQAKNFLVAYAQLKEKRLGKGAVRAGANLRAAWAFTLWGDPTLELPRPEAPESALPGLRHEVMGNTIVLSLPPEALARVKTDRYQVAMPPNARLAGLVRKAADEDGQPLVPFVFAEVHLPRGRPGRTPCLHSRLPARRWVFCWDERRRCGYLLATPRACDTRELRFHVKWQ